MSTTGDSAVNISARGAWGVVSKDIMRDPSISPQAKGLYALLATYADHKTRECHVGRERLAADLGVSVRSVSIWMKELLDNDALDRQYRGLARSRKTRLHDFILVRGEGAA